MISMSSQLHGVAFSKDMSLFIFEKNVSCNIETSLLCLKKCEVKSYASETYSNMCCLVPGFLYHI